MKVLIAIDCSPASERVIDEAAARPWPEGTTFSVVHVVDVQGLVRFPALVENAKREADRLVKAGKEKLSRSGHKTLSEVIIGFPRRGISEYPKEWHADLIMAGSHGHSAIGRFLLGSVAQGIPRTAPCSMETVRSASGGPAPFSHPMQILLATDGSDWEVAAVYPTASIVVGSDCVSRGDLSLSRAGRKVPLLSSTRDALMGTVGPWKTGV